MAEKLIGKNVIRFSRFNLSIDWNENIFGNTWFKLFANKGNLWSLGWMRSPQIQVEACGSKMHLQSAHTVPRRHHKFQLTNPFWRRMALIVERKFSNTRHNPGVEVDSFLWFLPRNLSSGLPLPSPKSLEREKSFWINYEILTCDFMTVTKKVPWMDQPQPFRARPLITIISILNQARYQDEKGGKQFHYVSYELLWTVMGSIRLKGGWCEVRSRS